MLIFRFPPWGVGGKKDKNQHFLTFRNVLKIGIINVR
jgi:hypothetical protein